MRVLGSRGHTLLATACVVITELILGCVAGPRRAFAALAPNWVGRTQTMALAARITTVGASVGFGQGELAGNRQNLHAVIKVLGPTMYGSLFAFGCKHGVPALPFYFSATVGLAAWLVVLSSPRHVWTDSPARLRVRQRIADEAKAEGKARSGRAAGGGAGPETPPGGADDETRNKDD